MQTWLLYLRDAIIRSSGIYSLIDTGARSTATALMQVSGNSYDAARVKLEAVKGECPVPEEYVSRKDAGRLSYQMLWAIRGSILDDGFTQANNDLKIALGLPAPPHIRTRFTRVAASAVVYIMLMALFISVCPLVGAIVETRYGFFWSDTTGCIRLSLKFTMAFTLPLLLAVSVYPLRRRAYHHIETPFQSIATVAAMQFAMSFILHEIYNVIEASVSFSLSDTSSLLDAKTHIITFLYSLTPILAFLAILISRKLQHHPLIAYAFICVLSGAAFALCDFVYELHNQVIDYYFVHQFVFGFWITLAFIICGRIRRN
ncbi:hypothetical protein IHQ71_05990 [Rhizobium sp. TH2]|uniref:hypothetical protein n=1 Tax=Rhizobium sp. TH2 TaxID=2775403 RepID=UPI002158248F|nr:hypothetical protein [Rhizobium sp. TH2]UVC10155.1 hypothetical protein IHQ71_05990 [Rhizobium sp. TH2]